MEEIIRTYAAFNKAVSAIGGQWEYVSAREDFDEVIGDGIVIDGGPGGAVVVWLT